MGNCFRLKTEKVTWLFPKTEQPLKDSSPELKVQRRRLSIAPIYVGNIFGSDVENVKSRTSVLVKDEKIKNNKPGADDDPARRIRSGPCAGYSFVSVTKKGYIPYNKGKQNQDSLISCEDLGRGIPLFGVLDGHGVNGANVSSFITEAIIELAKSYIKNEEDDEVNGKDMLKTIIARAVGKLAAESNIDISFSGTTLTLSTIVDNIVYTANIGDSRLIAIKEKNSYITAKALSFDHKPEIPEEMDRIEKRGGRVAPLPGPVGIDMGPQRVWLTDMDIPGLAMSRSIGDSIAQRVGVVDIPEITEYVITDNVLMFLWATDGIWEFLSNSEAAKIVIKAMEKELSKTNDGQHDRLLPANQLPIGIAAEMLIEESVNKWVQEEDAIDDCTALIVVVNPFKYRSQGMVFAMDQGVRQATGGY